MKFKQFYNEIVNYDAKVAQLMLAAMWLIYGFLLVFFQIPFVEKTSGVFDFLGHRFHGSLLILFGCLGFMGIYISNLKMNLAFSIFSIFNNAMMLIAIFMAMTTFHSGWVNEFVQLAVSIILFNRYNHLSSNNNIGD